MSKGKIKAFMAIYLSLDFPLAVLEIARHRIVGGWLRVGRQTKGVIREATNPLVLCGTLLGCKYTVQPGTVGKSRFEEWSIVAGKDVVVVISNKQ